MSNFDETFDFVVVGSGGGGFGICPGWWPAGGRAGG